MDERKKIINRARGKVYEHTNGVNILDFSFLREKMYLHDNSILGEIVVGQKLDAVSDNGALIRCIRVYSKNVEEGGVKKDLNGGYIKRR